MLMKVLPLLATNNTEQIAAIVVIVAAVLIIGLGTFGLALAAYNLNKKGRAVKKRQNATQPARVQSVKPNVSVQPQQQESADAQYTQPEEEKVEPPVQETACEEERKPGSLKADPGLRVVFYYYMPMLECRPPLMLPYEPLPLLPAAPVPLQLCGERQLAIAEHAEAVEIPANEGLTLKESIALAAVATDRRIRVNKETVAAWLTENYADIVRLNRRENKTKTGLPLADTHYALRNGKEKCFIYVYDLDVDKSMLLLNADYKTAEEIIGKYPSVKRSRFPKSTKEQWCTLVPNIGFETEQQIYDIISLVIARLVFGENAEPVKTVSAAEQPAAADDGLSLKESMAIVAAASSRHMRINKAVICDWLTDNYGETVKLNRRENKTRTGLPLADTHYAVKDGRQTCFIYVYELDGDKSMLLLKTDYEAAEEIIREYPSVKRSRFPKSTKEQWCALIPDVGFDNVQDIFDIITFVIARILYGEEAKLLKTVVPAEQPAPADEELTLKQSIALAGAATSRRININKSSVSNWLVRYYGGVVKIVCRENKTKTGLPLADTHYLIQKGRQNCFIYVYELDDGKSMLLFKTDRKTAEEIIGKHPSIKKSRFPKPGGKSQWCTLIPSVGFSKVREIYDIISLIIERAEKGVEGDGDGNEG